MAKKNAGPKKSSTPLILTIVAAVIAVGVLIGVSMNGAQQNAKGDDSVKLASAEGRKALGATSANAKVTLVEYGDFL